MSCREPQKGPKFSCSNFEQLKDIDSILELDQLQIVPDGEDEEALVSKPKKKKIKSAGPVEIAMGLADASLEEDPLKDDFVWEAMQKAYDPLTNTVRDLKIDDSALPRAKNYYHFCSKVAGTAIKLPFSRQLWIATHLYGEYCPRCTHKNFGNINKIPVDMDSTDLVDNITLLENGRCPKCKASKAKLVINKELLDYNQLVMVAGQRAGKSALTSTMAAYHLHLMLKAPRLSTICRGIQDFTPLTGTFVALSQTRSIKLLWNPFAQIVEASSWFQDLFSLLDHAGSQYDKEFYRKSTLYMRFYHRNLDYYPMGPMKRTLRGDCLVGSTMVNTDQGFVHFNELGFERGLVEKLGKIATLFGPRDFSHTYKKEGRETVRLSTRNNFRLEGTPEHPVLTLSSDLSFNWVPLGKIQTGDWIVSKTPKDIPLFGNNTLLTKQMACILGVFTANGYKSTISSNDPSVVKRFYKAVHSTIGKYPKVHGAPSDSALHVDSHFVPGNGIGHKGSFVDTLASWGYASVKSGKKQIPLSVRTAPKEILHEYLEAYFSCDSGINGGATKKARAKGQTTSVEIELTSASVKLVRQLQVILLQAYSIVGRLNKHVEFKSMGRFKQNAPKHYTYYTLTLTGYDAWQFIQTFKRAKVQKYAHRIKYSSPGLASDRRSIPYVKEALQEILNDAKKSGVVNARGYIHSTQGKGRLDQDFARIKNRGYGASSEGLIYGKNQEKLLSTLQLLNPDLAYRLGQLINSKAHFEEVVDVRSFERKVTVYDLTVPRGHAFTANGLVSHNTRCFSATDELGWFPYKETNYQDQDDEELEQVEDDEEDERERANGDEVHQSLDNSLATVRAEVWDLYKRDISSIPTGLNVNISSPQSWKDKICRLLKDSEDPATLSLGLRLPTWEINPIFTRDHPIITSAYAKNFRRADRDYGANPPKLSATLFIKEAVQKSFHGKQHYTVTYNEDEPEYTVGKLKELIVKNKWEACTMGMDAGLNNNSFAIAVGSRAETLVNTHCIFELIPSRTKPVFYPRLYRDVLLPLIKACNVVYVGADRWNSINLLQQIQEDTKGRTKTMMLTLNTNHFNYFKDLVNTNNLILPEMEWAFDTVEGVNNYKRELKNHPIEHLYLQFLTVREQLAGVGKGEGNTDDLWRALVVMSTMHFIPKVKEYLGEFKAQERTDTSSRSTVLLAGRSGLGYLR